MAEQEGAVGGENFKKTVPIEVVELAYATNEAFDAAVRLEDAKRTVETTERDLSARKVERLTALSEDTALDHDEFLREYQEVLRMGGSRLPRVAQFEQALTLRERLVPGEFLLLPSDEVVKIKQPKNKDEDDGIRPRIKYDEEMNKDRRLSHSHAYEDVVYLYWEVPVEEKDKPVSIANVAKVGREAVLESLNNKWSRYPDNPDLLMYVPLGVDNYEKIGETEKAEALKKIAIARIKKHFDDEVFTPRPLFTPNVMESFFVLRLLSPEVYETIIKTTKKHAASGKYTQNILHIVKDVADENVKNEIRSKKRTEYTHPTPAQVAQLFADFAKEGEELLAAEQK